jgi:hypothetical protein
MSQERELEQLRSLALKEIEGLEKAGFDMKDVKKNVEEFDAKKFINSITPNPADAQYGALN